MRVAFLGNHGVSYSTETHVAEALECNGCEVVRIQEGQPARQIPAQVEGSDVFLWTKTPSLAKKAGSLDDQAAMLDSIKGQGILTTAYHLDRYFDLKREHQVMDHPWWRSDIVFSADGGNQDRFSALGVNHRWLPAAVRAAEVGHGRIRQHFRHDVVFVGSGGGYHPEWPWRQDLLQGLRARYGRRFVQFPRTPHRPVRGGDLADLYASAKVVVGDSILADRCRDYWSDRIYETVGRGGVLVHPFVAGLDAHFTAGEQYLAYQAGSLTSVYEAVDRLLADPDLRSRLKAAGPPHVAAHHTYTHRMATYLESIGA